MPSRKRNSLYRTSIGAVLKAWRLERGLTQEQLAQRCRMNGSTIVKGYLSQVETERVDLPNDLHLSHLAKALVIPDEFLQTRKLPTDLSPEEGQQYAKAWQEQLERERQLKDGAPHKGNAPSRESVRVNQQTPISLSEEKQFLAKARERGEEEMEEAVATATFASPLEMSLNEDVFLYQMLEKLEEMQNLVKACVAQKGRK